MGVLLSKIWSRLLMSQEKKIVIVGLDNAGKSTILYQFLLGQAIQIQPTIGSNVEEITYKNIKFLMWDLGGQTSLRQSWHAYYKSTSAVILVIDSTDKERLDISKIMRQLETDLKESILLVFANKQDVENSLKPNEISDALGLVNFKDRAWHIQGCCALTGDGLYKGLDWVVSSLTV
ncbi:uncharacterized protein T551_02830 [Pneumocystis jirovecii RU7]|uniref:ADP-ribosylation factor-like protein 5A n=1 Tax=Pneumocystis jirovecii (strain RU7) TaxID=1408657 RepID=A0A0W4ZHL6_PNEJ7|nr:uncharacterized protein T551_02830 [Pneumocystis jirovecii RU7]KTW27863.1 hypothetical protein T551_02830 [Pneumocystis jirovecii RU7]